MLIRDFNEYDETQIKVNSFSYQKMSIKLFCTLEYLIRFTYDFAKLVHIIVVLQK